MVITCLTQLIADSSKPSVNIVLAEKAGASVVLCVEKKKKMEGACDVGLNVLFHSSKKSCNG